MTQTCVRQSDLGTTKHTSGISQPLAVRNPTINTTFSCGNCEKLMVVQQLVPGTKTSCFSLHGIGCKSPRIILVGSARTCFSNVTPLSSPLGLLLTPIFHFFRTCFSLCGFSATVPWCASGGCVLVGRCNQTRAHVHIAGTQMHQLLHLHYYLCSIITSFFAHSDCTMMYYACALLPFHSTLLAF